MRVLRLIFPLLLGCALWTATATQLHAQLDTSDAMSDAEVEKLRDSAYVANDRVVVFQSILQSRIEQIDKLVSKPRHAGREEDIHDLIEQFRSIADELDDNVDEYGKTHRDVRKAVPRLLKAIDAWEASLKKPADNDAYNVSRQLALESIADLRKDVNDVLAEEKEWFAAHPPQKQPSGSEVPS
jgi:chromosome segregation ATPase